MLKTNTKKSITIAAVLVILMMIIPTLIASTYTVFVADDFGHAERIGVFQIGLFDYLKISLDFAIDRWKNWQGTYFSMFIQALLSPLNNWGFLQLKCIMLINSLLLWVSLLYFLYVFLNQLISEKHISLCIIALITFSLTSYMAYEEIYYWFSGATSYSMPLSLLFISLAAFLNYVNTHKNKYLFISGILGFISMGGALTITGMGAYTLLLMCLYFCLKEKKLSKAYIFLFTIWLIGALLNAGAPGNFSRHSIIDDSGLHFFDALIFSVKCYLERLSFFLGQTNYLVVIVLFIICGFFANKTSYKNIDLKRYTVLSILSLFAPIITAFPVALGYSNAALPNRCIFILDIAILFVFANMFCLIGCCLSYLCANKSKKIVLCLLCLFALVLQVTGNLKPQNIVSYEIAKQIYTHKYSDYYSDYVILFNKLGDYSKNEDVRIPVSELPDQIDHFFNFNIHEEPEHWANDTIADFFGFTSISLKLDSAEP